MTDIHPVRLDHLKSIRAILGTAKVALWPFSERMGITFAGIAPGADLIHAESGAPAANRMPLLMPDNFESLKLVSWRVEVGVPDPHNPLL